MTDITALVKLMRLHIHHKCPLPVGKIEEALARIEELKKEMDAAFTENRALTAERDAALRLSDLTSSADEVAALAEAEARALAAEAQVERLEGPKCGLCGLPIHPQESGVRHFGFYTAHSERRCRDLLRLRAEDAEARALAAEAQVASLADDVVALAEHCGELANLSDGPCPSEGLCGEYACGQIGCIKDKADHARQARSTLLSVGGGKKASVAESAAACPSDCAAAGPHSQSEGGAS